MSSPLHRHASGDPKKMGLTPTGAVETRDQVLTDETGTDDGNGWSAFPIFQIFR
jgi:hypothetical protein